MASEGSGDTSTSPTSATSTSPSEDSTTGLTSSADTTADSSSGGSSTTLDPGTADATDPSDTTAEGSTTAPQDESRTVFLIAETVAPADFGGVEGADAICQAAADDAGLEGTFLAWLSSADENEPAARFSQSGGPFVRTDGIIIADDWADLTDGQLIAPIDHDATGSAVVHPNGIDVITATAADGTRATGGIATCASYTQDVALAQPDRGNSNAIDSNWSAIGDTWDCGIAGAGLYCFEQ